MLVPNVIYITLDVPSLLMSDLTSPKDHAAPAEVNSDRDDRQR